METLEVLTVAPLLSPTDLLFQLAESPTHPMHVGGLLIFSPPDSGTFAEVHRALDAAVCRNQIGDFLRRTARRSAATAGLLAWHDHATADVTEHVQRHTLAPGAGSTELFELCSQLHAAPLDRERPLWEMHFIDGLAHDRFAIYAKIHHSLADGTSAIALLRRALCENPDRHDMPAPWEPIATAAKRAKAALPGLGAMANTLVDSAKILPAVADTVTRAAFGRGGPLSISAPKTPFNQDISTERAFAAHSWPLERLRLVAKATDCTVNDVVLAMCSGALRGYLEDSGELPDASLVAMVPVSLRERTDQEAGGNKLGVVMCNLGTNLDNPRARLAKVHGCMNQGKEVIAGRGPVQLLVTSALGIAALAPGVLLGRDILPRPPFNVVISNVPGPDRPLYWNGALLEEVHPLSIPLPGQALNITCTSNHYQISFGLTACRKAVPDPQRILDKLDVELRLLEAAAGM
ncbi:wax ester/triacylglycerol synthase family O-acyltransferase [Skermania sp. ID1734]|uniref:WS/DGAT/MGAT family O-acyltransferase n=1 Tax=Skermania sp. ID1734 TaxID=2597516 RepID=UPI00118052B5|nr:wax ester/triacylglycerol synthase family O-acyltransferase [Skermania sp. ID1734]TSE01850.1 wax ester/triacylglycerol synthase family O-acyltransferase [Skermania sp. ID1734]